MATDITGKQLEIGGHPVIFEQVIGSKSEVDSLYPAPEGQYWVQFQSTLEFMAMPGDGSLTFNVNLSWPDEQCQNLQGQPLATWLSDNRDDLYGSVVTDAFEENTFPSDEIPTLTEWGMIIFCALLFSWMAWVIVRRRKQFA